MPPDWFEGVIDTEKEGQEFGTNQGDLKEASNMACLVLGE